MNDYQHLIDELTWFAEQDKDFIALHESINTKAAEAIKMLVAERDAAFAMSRCECETNEACKNLVALHEEVERLKQERGAALARLSEERDIWDRMFGDGVKKLEHLEMELDDCLYVLDALWDKQCNKTVTLKWAEILLRNKRDIGASSVEDSYLPSTE